MVALRDIAESLAKAGYFDEALAASKIIPDSLKMADALASIAEILAEHDNTEQARRIVTELVVLLSHRWITRSAGSRFARSLPRS